jgi:hypothetical protein
MPLAGGACSSKPKLSHALRTIPPSSTMPAGVCHIVIFSTSAHAQTPLSDLDDTVMPTLQTGFSLSQPVALVYASVSQ